MHEQHSPPSLEKLPDLTEAYIHSLEQRLAELECEIYQCLQCLDRVPEVDPAQIASLVNDLSA
jgi:hypothetical protein